MPIHIAHCSLELETNIPSHRTIRGGRRSGNIIPHRRTRQTTLPLPSSPSDVAIRIGQRRRYLFTNLRRQRPTQRHLPRFLHILNRHLHLQHRGQGGVGVFSPRDVVGPVLDLQSDAIRIFRLKVGRILEAQGARRVRIRARQLEVARIRTGQRQPLDTVAIGITSRVTAHINHGILGIRHGRRPCNHRGLVAHHRGADGTFGHVGVAAVPVPIAHPRS